MAFLLYIHFLHEKFSVNLAWYRYVMSKVTMTLQAALRNYAIYCE
jgi:hypothetical protein